MLFSNKILSIFRTCSGIIIYLNIEVKSIQDTFLSAEGYEKNCQWNLPDDGHAIP